VFKDLPQQIPDATLVVQSNSYMFYKELLLNKLEPLVPEKYTKLVFLDADVLLDSPDWLDQISKSLDKYDIIQPFREACWLTPDNTRVAANKLSYGFALAKKRPLTMSTFYHYHPGFAWAFKRDVFRKVGGFYDKSIIGGGDIALVLAMFPGHVSDSDFIRANAHGRFGEFVLESWREYYNTFKEVNPRIGCLPIKLFHLFHGVTKDRNYTERYRAISKVLTGGWNDEIFLNKDGLFEFNNPIINDVLYKYFKDRNEDIPLREAEDYTRRRRHRPRPFMMRRKRRFIPEFNQPTIESNGTLETADLLNTAPLQK
jgi:hypothetical protein